MGIGATGPPSIAMKEECIAKAHCMYIALFYGPTKRCLMTPLLKPGEQAVGALLNATF
jgi:hypothetical protein